MEYSEKITFSPTSKAALEKVADFKGGSLLRGNDKLFFFTGESLTAMAYPSDMLDFLLDWGRTPLTLTPQMRAVVTASGRKNEVPVRIELKSGKSFGYGMLRFTNHPPAADWFENRWPRWYYITDVQSLEACPQFVPDHIMAKLEKVKKANSRILNEIRKIKGNLLDSAHYAQLVAQHEYLVVKDKSGVKYKFDELFSQWIFDYSIPAAEFMVCENPTAAELAEAKDISDRDHEERGRVQRDPVVYIFADQL